MSNKQKLEWHNEQRKGNDLLPFKQNPRTMSEKQRSDLIRSIEKFGLVEIPAVTIDGKILAGHQRVAVLQFLNRGNELIDVRVPNRALSKKEYEQYLLTSNRVHGEWQYEMLSQYFDIDTMLISGFDDTDLSTIFADTLETTDDNYDWEEEIKKVKKAKAKLGDIYQLGPHRLGCLDSLIPENIKKLVGDEKIDTIYCDPIFNLKIPGLYDKGVGGKQHYGGTVKDSKTDVEYRAYLKASMESALLVTKPDAHIYYFCDQTYIGMVQSLFTELGLDNKRVCIWCKGSANPTPGVAWNKSYEACVYSTRGKPYLSPTSLNFTEVLNKELGPNGNKLIDDIADQFDIWIARRVAGQEYCHSTQKPITLHERPIKRCTRPGDKILDLFGGSGSTLLAADAMKRVCFMSEIEPIFIDLIINRYEQATGIKARKIN
jgi:DNA modification methylase